MSLRDDVLAQAKELSFNHTMEHSSEPITKDKITRIIQQAVLSPTADNCQPFTFSWRENELLIYHSHLLATHPLNVRNIPSMLSLGCLVEAIDLSASEFSLDLKYEIFDILENKKSLCCRIVFNKSLRYPHKLLPALAERTTDRRLYTRVPLPLNLVADIENSELPGVKIHLAGELKSALKDYLLSSEKFLLEGDNLPCTLEWVRLTPNEISKTRDGMPWKSIGAHG